MFILESLRLNIATLSVTVTIYNMCWQTISNIISTTDKGVQATVYIRMLFEYLRTVLGCGISITSVCKLMSLKLYPTQLCRQRKLSPRVTAQLPTHNVAARHLRDLLTLFLLIIASRDLWSLFFPSFFSCRRIARMLSAKNVIRPPQVAT